MQLLRKQSTQLSVFGLLMLCTMSGAALAYLFTIRFNGLLLLLLLLLLVIIVLLIVQKLFADYEQEKARYDSLRALAKFLPDRVVILDKHGRFVEVINRRHHTGIVHPTDAINNIIGKTVHEVYPKEFAEFCLMIIGETLASDTARIIEYNSHGSKGELLYFEGRVVPFTDSMTGEQRVLWSSRDISERIYAEKARLDLALERNKVQFMHEFVSNMTHDFKTPLAIISTNAYIIGKTRDEKQHAVRLERIQEEVKKLTQMVDDMLESARLEGATNESFEPTALQTMLKQIVHELQSKAEQKSLNLIADLEIAPEREVQAIPRELNRALTNLVENAVKYTPDGGDVKVRLFAKQDDAIIEVVDTGIGIDAADFDNIFTRFYRTDSGRFHTSGTGLGLAIVKMIIDRHGGNIEVESELEKGSTFRISLPLIAAPEIDTMSNTPGM